MQEKKKKYLKPKINRIKIDAKTAVLNVCKVSHGPGGPLNKNCRGGVGGICREPGS